MFKSKELCIVAADTVKKACEQYWLSGEAVPFTDRLADGAIVTGLDSFEKDGKYSILDEKYNTCLHTEDLCTVSGSIVLCNTSRNLTYRVDSNITVLCKITPDGITFLSVHLSSRRRRLINAEQISPDYYYRKLLDSLCDVFIEVKEDKGIFQFDKERYYGLFHEHPEFVSMDDWFWHLCDKFVLEQDLEILDLFRDSDIEKRLSNNDLIIDTSFRIHRDEGEIIWINMKIVFIPDELNESVSDVFILLKDCTVEITEKMRNIKYARMDSLTQIWNRRYTVELIEDKIYQNRQGIFVLLDIDKFKNINDMYGHITGDEILVKITSIISSKISEGDVFGRLGGDEFVLYLKRSGNTEEDRIRVNEIISATKFHHCEKEQGMDIHCSAGAVFFNSGFVSFEQLYQAADEAMYKAKEAGRDTVKIGEV